MTLIPVTHSEINAFLTCRRAWSWRNLHEYQQPERFDGALALGTRVHASIEAANRGGDALAEHYRLAREAADKLEPLVDAGVRPGWQLDQLWEDIVVGRNCVEAYIEWREATDAYDGLTLESVEKTLEVPILDGRAMLRGKADAIWNRNNGMGLVIEDYKTSGAWWGGQRELLERSYQHHVYIALLSLLEPEVPTVEARYTVIKKVKDRSRATSPMVEHFKVPATIRTGPVKMRQIELIVEEMLRAIEMMETTGSALMYPTPGQQCRWCDYKQPCEVVDESPLAAREMLDRLYVRSGRHARYGTELK